METLTYLPDVTGGQSMSTSCDKVLGPAKKPQEVFNDDSVSPTVTVTFWSRYDKSKVKKYELIDRFFLFVYRDGESGGIKGSFSFFK